MKDKIKKAQLKIQEMAFMIVAVFLFFVLVGIFALSIIYSNLSESATKIAEERTLSSLLSLSNTPELNCGRLNCIDGEKLISIIGKSRYQNLWPYSSLKVISYDGFDKNESDLIECNFSNYPNCNLYIVYDKRVKNERAISSFVALCRKEVENKIYEKCETAKIIAGTELK